MIVLAFYKYVEIEDVKGFRENLLELCLSLGLHGRILVASEGINGSVSGKKEECGELIDYFYEDGRFDDMMFKEQESLEHGFKKMQVKLKKRVLPFEFDVNLSRTGDFLDPKEFLDIYDENGELKKGVVLIDNRNDYEFNVGRFKGALKPGVNKFRDFPKIVEKLRGQEDKKIVMYCTGGIRCEKASAYMKEEGFKDVKQLRGGILAFGPKKPNAFWEGKCFVFDKRLLSSVNSSKEKFADCELCSEDCDRYQDCKYPQCNRFVALCLGCFEGNQGCCSTECLGGYEEFLREKMEKNRGKSLRVAT